MADGRVSLRDVLSSTVDILEQIPVPVSYIDQIANPISIAVKNLQACVEAIDSANAEKPRITIEEDNSNGTDTE